jgi:hypothetical protein
MRLVDQDGGVQDLGAGDFLAMIGTSALVSCHEL